MGLFDAITGAVIGTADIGLGIANTVLAQKNADRNYGQQQDVLSWQKSAQEKTWLREDTAVQRRVADLKAAGLSPTLAAGSAASTSSPVSVSAPQRQHTDINQRYAEQAATMMALMRGRKDITKTEAETQYIASQIAHTNLLNQRQRDVNQYANARERAALQRELIAEAIGGQELRQAIVNADASAGVAQRREVRENIENNRNNLLKVMEEREADIVRDLGILNSSHGGSGTYHNVINAVNQLGNPKVRGVLDSAARTLGSRLGLGLGSEQSVDLPKTKFTAQDRYRYHYMRKGGSGFN